MLSAAAAAAAAAAYAIRPSGQLSGYQPVSMYECSAHVTVAVRTSLDAACNAY
eukprot:COSAG06_NODE_751_length_12582_cov_40.259072_2_plen_53_part_00